MPWRQPYSLIPGAPPALSTFLWFHLGSKGNTYYTHIFSLCQVSPVPKLQTTTYPWPVRNPASWQEVSGGPVALQPELRHPRQISRWHQILMGARTLLSTAHRRDLGCVLYRRI